MQDVVIELMKDFIYRLTSNVLESPFAISSFYVAGGVSFIIFFYLWYGGA